MFRFLVDATRAAETSETWNCKATVLVTHEPHTSKPLIRGGQKHEDSVVLFHRDSHFTQRGRNGHLGKYRQHA